MTRRPRVLVAIQPPLLADLVRSALPAEFDVVVQPVAASGWRRWDVAVVPQGTHGLLRARHVVSMSSKRADSVRRRRQLIAPDFGSLVVLVRRLCEVRPAG
jgi:hypothetical protein